jgi:hypothetical protein
MAVTDEVEAGYDCDFCGEDCKGQNYVSLFCFGTYHEELDDCLFFDPAEDPALVDVWTDLTPIILLHLTCVGNYFDGLHASMRIRHREEKPNDD